MKNFDHWCDDVVRCVRFTPDRPAIAKELRDHYEDSVKDFIRVGYDEKLAETRALTAMGDAEEVGRAMDEAHKPWLGWLWQVSRVSLFIVLGFMLLCITYYEIPEVQTWLAPEPFFERISSAAELPCPKDFEDGVFDYRFNWAEYTYDETRDVTTIHITATVSTYYFWLNGPDFYEDLTASDSIGRSYRSGYSSFDSVEGFTSVGHGRYNAAFTIKVKGPLPEWIDVTNTVAGWTFRLYIPGEGGTA